MTPTRPLNDDDTYTPDEDPFTPPAPRYHTNEEMRARLQTWLDQLYGPGTVTVGDPIPSTHGAGALRTFQAGGFIPARVRDANLQDADELEPPDAETPTMTRGIEAPPNTDWVTMERIGRPRHKGTGTMITPDTPSPHVCDQPKTWTLDDLPVPGTTWDCPKCGRVWVIVATPFGSQWRRASWRQARRHRRQVDRREGL